MWPIILNAMRRNVPYIALPFAAVIGFIGYHLEDRLSSKYTPYSESIQEVRMKRLSGEGALDDASDVKKLKLNENVLERNLSPSLQRNLNQ